MEVLIKKSAKGWRYFNSWLILTYFWISSMHISYCVNSSLWMIWFPCVCNIWNAPTYSCNCWSKSSTISDIFIASECSSIVCNCLSSTERAALMWLGWARDLQQHESWALKLHFTHSLLVWSKQKNSTWEVQPKVLHSVLHTNYWLKMMAWKRWIYLTSALIVILW